MTDITYRVEGDHLIPELVLDGEGYEYCLEEEIGRYGELREHFLREYQYGTYTAMLLMGSLTTHQQEIDRQAEDEISAQKDDGEAGHRRGPESLGSDDVGAEGQCAEGDGRGSGASGDCVSVSRIYEDKKI